MVLAERMREIARELERAQEEMRIVAEQIDFQVDVVSEVENRAVVSESPFDRRELEEARRDLERLKAHWSKQEQKVRDLTLEQDRILDEMSRG